MALRCFIAVPLPTPLKNEIGGIIGRLRKTGADVRWVRDENLHLTLKFLGATEETRISEIRDALRKKLSPYPPFYIKISGIGYFPEGRHPRVIWIGIEELGRLANVYSEVEEVMAKFGYPREERPFSPHLTIGRVRSPKGISETLRRLDELRAVSFEGFEVKAVQLMKSDLKPGGAEYSELAEIFLEGNNNE